MRFENILHIYWTKGIFISGKLYYFDSSIKTITESTYGINNKFKNLVRSRFETGKNNIVSKSLLYKEDSCRMLLSRPLNLIFSQLFSVNNSLSYLIKLKIIYQFLIKSYKGRCHYFGKPVRGQRT
jgi:ribosomal protein S13